MLFFGCDSTQTIGSLDAPRLDPSPFIRIGKITHIDLRSATVVVLLDRNNTTLPEDLFVRDNRLDVIAKLRPTGIRTGKSVGMVLVQGNPKIGQEVVMNSIP